MQRIVAKFYKVVIEGIVVDGAPLGESSPEFDLDAEFTMQSDDGVLHRVQGWAADVTLVDT